MTATETETIEFTDEIAQAVRDTQHAIDLGRDLPVDIVNRLLDVVGRDRLKFPQPQQINGLVKAIHVNIHPEKYSIIDQGPDEDRDMIEDFETFKRIITRPRTI